MMRRCFVLLILLASLVPASAAIASSLEKLIMPGRVITGHAETEGECGACHDADSDQASANLCIACHEDVGEDRANFTGFHGQFEAASRNECIACHTDHEGRDADIVQLEAGLFDHAFTDFPLRGAHSSVACGDCHDTDDKYRNAPPDCVGCHEPDDVHEAALGPHCQNCHTETDWTETVFDHNDTDYPLTGRHSTVLCVDCHRGNVFDGTPTGCNACHAIDDVHQGNNGPACQDCHSTETWQSIGFNHALETGFALQDGHGGLSCQDCHTREDFKDDFADGCASCHLGEDDHQGRNGMQCGDCHTAVRWSDTKFDHTETGFVLEDAHADLNCVACHKTEVERSLPTDCAGCHALDDSHGGQMPEDCGFCHQQTRWDDAIAFDHDLSTFPLTGLHAPIPCGACHESNRFHDAASGCADCHADDDVHQGKLGNECGDCHTSNGWAMTVFDHDLHTTFKLDGGHRDIGCIDCHRDASASAADVPSNCGGCHAADDPHDGEFGAVCGQCHNTTSFSDVDRL